MNFNRKLTLLLLLISKFQLMIAMQRNSELHSFNSIGRHFQQTNWIALQELHTLTEGHLPLLYQPSQIPIQQIFASNFSASQPLEIAPQPLASQTIIQLTPYFAVNSAPLRTANYQSAMEVAFSNNSSQSHRNQLLHLENQISSLARRPAEFAIYVAKHTEIISKFNSTIKILRESIRTPIDQSFRFPEAITQTTKSLLKLPELKFSHPGLDAHLQEVTSRIQKAATDESTHALNPLNIHIKQKETSLSKAIDNLETNIHYWLADPSNIIKQALEDTQNFLAHGERSGSSINKTNQDLLNSIRDCSYNNNLEKMIRLCANDRLSEALEIGLQYPSGIEVIPFQAIYESTFSKNFTPEHIDKRYINDPLYLSHKNELVGVKVRDLFSIPHPLNSDLSKRYDFYAGITKELDLKNPSPELNQFIYKVISNELENPTSSISPSKTFIGLAKHPITNLEQAAFIKTGMNYLQIGLSKAPEAKSFLRLAEASNRDLNNPKGMQIMSKLTDYTIKPNSVHQQDIQNAAVRLIADNIEASANPSLSHQECQSHLDVIKRVDHAIRGMHAGDIRADFYLQHGLTPKLNKEVLSVDYDAQMAHFAGIKQDAIVAHVKERKDLTTVMLKNGAEFTLEKYEMLPSVEKFLVNRGLDPAKYQSCYGHQLQQAIHKNILAQVVKQHELSGLQLIETSNLNQLLNLSSQISDLSREHNTIGNVGQAGLLSNFCWEAMHYIENASKYGWDTVAAIGEGTLQGVSSTIYTITHPYEFAQNLGNLGLILVKAVQGNELLNQMSIFKSDEENLKIAQQFKKEYGPIFEAIGKSIDERLAQTTYRDVVREGTAFVVSGRLTTRTLAKLGEVAKIASVHANKVYTNSVARAIQEGQRRAIQAFKKSVTPHSIATTAEGIQIRAAQATENCVLSEAQQIGYGARIVDASKTGSFSPQAIEKGVEYLMSRRKIEHIFEKTIHNLDPLVAKLGGHEATIREILIAANGKLPISGIFEDIVVNVSGYEVYIRGKVIDGVPKLGTFYIK